MNQQKIGEFLKELRKQKGLTQEQFAEIVNVSNRTVSRWENGNNLPDLDILIEISDYYEIDLRELLNGEKKGEKMYKEAVAYTNNKTERYTRGIRWLLLAGVVFWFTAQLIQHTELAQITIISNFSEFAKGAACGLLICVIIVTSRYGKRLRDFKKRLLKRQ